MATRSTVRWQRILFSAIGLAWGSWVLLPPAWGKTGLGTGDRTITPPTKTRTTPSRPKYQCPTDIRDLTAALIRDLPSYANRVIVRNKRRQDLSTAGSVILAGRAEFEPLPVQPGPTQPGESAPSPDGSLQQVFLTTLERQNSPTQIVEFQQFHWLFFVQTRYGWQLSQSFTRTSSYPAGKVITPPRESSQAPIAQAIQIWLRDCNARAIR